jgi:hypothetical protein
MEKEIQSEIENVSISKIDAGNENLQNLPFENVDILKGFNSNPEILNYALARKIAWLELAATGLDKEMGWEANKPSLTPVVIYGFDNKPKFYDFIVMDAEENMTGTVTVYARRNAGTVIKALSSEIKDYNGLLSKVGNTASLFIDWAGNSYAGIRGKAGDVPTSAVNTVTGEAAGDVEEIEGEQIIEEMRKNVLPALLSFNPDVTDANSEQYADLLTALQNKSVDAVVDSMLLALTVHQNSSEAYWNFIEEFLPEIEQLDDDDIISDSGKGLFSRIISAIRRVFSGVDGTKYYLNRYVTSGKYRTPLDWCGPWVCGYIWKVKSGQDRYSSFENCASTVGELGVLNFALRLLGRPMTPVEMAWSMPAISAGSVWIDPDLRFVDYAAYDQIKYNKRPALRLCSAGGNLHWTIAYGTYQTGSYLWRTYYFMQQDNGTLFRNGEYKNPTDNNSYSQVDWWNPWILVWD